MNHIYPYRECTSFVTCSAPKCPLDPDMDLRSERYPEEEKCKSYKHKRYRIGSEYHNLLPHKGLTSREWSSYKNLGYSDTQINNKLFNQGTK